MAGRATRSVTPSTSYYADTALQDHVAAESFARAGLASNPNDALLLNNLAVAVARQGRISEAAETLAKVPQSAAAVAGDEGGDV